MLEESCGLFICSEPRQVRYYSIGISVYEISYSGVKDGEGIHSLFLAHGENPLRVEVECILHIIGPT